jgi:tRNA(Arg) A34 adenosine deaminase TadA
MSTESNIKYMHLAVEEASQGLEEGGVPVGAALVHLICLLET